MYEGGSEIETDRKWVGEGKLFAISKFLRAKHSSVQRLIAFLLEGVEKIHFSTQHKKKQKTQSIVCVFVL